MTEDPTQKESNAPCGCGSRPCGNGKWIWMALALAVVAVFLAKSPCALKCRSPQNAPPATAAVPAAVSAGTLPALAKAPARPQALPRLVDLGAGKCIPCKMMVPILEELKKTYEGKLDVVFIDVWEKPDEAKKFGINMIPTQIFYDLSGKELFRHEGFFGKDDILAKWKELGVDLGR